MKKSIIIGSLALFCNTLFATPLPNIWTSGFGQGWLEYNISNAQKIEVYNENKKIGEFNPTKQSTKKVLGNGLCDPMI
jgi:hypothetical protein